MTPANPPLGSKILLWDRGGKSTLARGLSDKLQQSRLGMDAIAWLPRWQMRDRDESTAIIDRFTDDHSDGWIIDDQHSVALDETLRRADTVIWLDLPFWTVYRRIVRRSFKRAWDGQEVCGDNVETRRHLLTSRDSLPYFYLRRLLIGGNWKKQIAAREALLAESGAHVTLIRLFSAGELDEFYAENGLARPVD